ncbi:DDE-domain-containing protein, partial [Zopfia rhizophila CBS 207.26]
VTTILAISTLGYVIPLFIIYKGKNHLSLNLTWLKHFNKCIKERSVSAYRLLIINSYKSHNSLAFTEYCKENKIITLYIPAHSSHILQPLDVGCFWPLKRAYRR